MTKQEMIEKYQKQLQDLSITVNQERLEWVVDCVGPANYSVDGQLVAATDNAEVQGVYTGFVADELAETDQEKGMQAIADVLNIMKDIKRKYRAVVYYLLAEKYGK